MFSGRQKRKVFHSFGRNVRFISIMQIKIRKKNVFCRNRNKLLLSYGPLRSLNQRTQEFPGSLPSSSSLTDSLCHYQGIASSRKYLFGICCFFREAGDCRAVFLMLSPKAAFLWLPTVWILVLPLTVIYVSTPSSFSSSSSSSFSFGVDRVSGLFIKVTHVHGSNLESTTHNTWHIHTTQHTVLLCSSTLKCVLSCWVMFDSVIPCTVACHVPLSLWNFPGKNTGVGYHFLLHYLEVTTNNKWHLFS